MILRILSVALAAWLGAGAIAVGAAHTRFGLTPSIAWIAAAAIAAIVVRRSSIALLALVLLLPWLPLRVPAAFLMWTGHASQWIGLLIAGAIAAREVRRNVAPALRDAISDPRRAPVIAFLIASGLFLAGAWAASPQLPAGDEPHYLVITQSLVTDHDLQIENNHRRGDYHAYLSGELRPDYLRRGTNDQIYSIHAPGLPALVAPAFALFGYRGVVIFLALVNAAAAALAWTVAWRVSGSPAGAWFGWAAVTLSAPYFAQSFMVYPDAPAGAIVMLAIATLVAGREATPGQLALTGVALALLPWLHTRAVLLAVPLAAVIAARQPVAKRVAVLAAAPVVSAIAWFAFFYVIYGTPDPRAPYGSARQMALASLPNGVTGLLFDQQFGLLPNAPVYFFAVLGFIPLIRRHRRLGVELLASLLPYAITVAAFQMWWAGYTTPARFLVAALPPLAIPAAVWFASVDRPAARALALAGLAVSVLVTFSIVFVDRGAMLLNFRDGASRLLIWLSPVIDLTRAVPSLFQSTPRAVALQAAAWLIGGCVALATANASSLTRLDSDRAATVVGAVAISMTMAAAAIVWRSNDAATLKTDGGAVPYLTAYDGDARQIGISLSPLHRLRRADIPPRLILVDGRPAANEPLAYLRHIPAARYAIDIAFARATAGRVTVALDRGVGPAWSFDVGDPGAWRREVDVPVASPAFLVDADPAVRAAIDRVTLRALTVPGASHRVATSEAVQVARYGRVLMFMLDGDAFMEPEGTWVQGASSATFAMVTDDGGPVRLLVRTPPIANHVTLDGDGWHRDVALAAGESQIIDVPTQRFGVKVRSGARPTDFEEGNSDIRFLGARLEPR